MKKICIAVACHKPSRLPVNSLLVPVQVNSANASMRMDMHHDDEGDNISLKNPQYCELTAQYWEWKNVDADYYGLCHYRRFICFEDVKEKKNIRSQYESWSINDFTLKKYGLEDEEKMRRIIEDSDVVTGPLQDVKKLFTPHGNQRTAYLHWTAHDRALINVKDFETMLNILSDVNPELGADAREYLAGDKFGGFNCFVMRKDLFDEMCRIEFEVLSRLEKTVDDRNYCQQLSRIYGFMGEIISSSYFYHLEKSGKYRVKHLPLVYFENTDQTPVIEPVPGEERISVLFESDNFGLSSERSDPLDFGIQFRAFLDHITPSRKYDVIAVVPRMNLELKKIYQQWAEKTENVTLRLLDETLITGELRERFGKEFETLLFVPYLLSGYQKLIIFTPNTMITDNIDSMWETDLGDDVAAAPYDLEMIARVNDIYPETDYNYLKEELKDPYEFYTIRAFVLNPERFCSLFTPDQVVKASLNAYGNIRRPEETFNILLEGKIRKIDQKYHVLYESDDYLRYQLPYLPLRIQQDLKKARVKPAVVSYLLYDPLVTEPDEVGTIYWKMAEETGMYPFYSSLAQERLASRPKEKTDITHKLFPKGSKGRTELSLLFPKGTNRYKAIKKALSIFNME